MKSTIGTNHADDLHPEYALNAVNQGVTALGIKGEIRNKAQLQTHLSSILYFAGRCSSS